jgi:hypothetical protein
MVGGILTLRIPLESNPVQGGFTRSFFVLMIGPNRLLPIIFARTGIISLSVMIGPNRLLPIIFARTGIISLSVMIGPSRLSPIILFLVGKLFIDYKHKVRFL